MQATRPRSDFDIALELTRSHIDEIEFLLGAYSPAEELPTNIERAIATANTNLRSAFSALRRLAARTGAP